MLSFFQSTKLFCVFLMLKVHFLLLYMNFTLKNVIMLGNMELFS
jgi:hypothetical protein